MHPLEAYYLNQADRGLSPTLGIGPIYSVPQYLQRGHGIGKFLSTLFRFVRPLLWTVGRTGGKNITDIAKLTQRACRGYIETCRRCHHRIHTTFNQQIAWSGFKRVRRETSKGRGAIKPKKTPAKRARVIKRDIFS